MGSTFSKRRIEDSGSSTSNVIPLGAKFPNVYNQESLLKPVQMYDLSNWIAMATTKCGNFAVANQDQPGPSIVSASGPVSQADPGHLGDMFSTITSPNSVFIVDSGDDNADEYLSVIDDETGLVLQEVAFQSAHSLNSPAQQLENGYPRDLMAYNGGPTYIDVTQPPLKKPEEQLIISESDMENSGGRYYNSTSGAGRSPRYPHCIVWTPIPLITYLFPCIGHMGICKSNGVIRDFAASYHVSADSMAFGDPTKIVQLDPTHIKSNIDWDTAVEEAAHVYEHRMHNLCCDNCHSMVALALNKMAYNGKTNWNMVSVWGVFVCRGKYLGCGAATKTLAPFCILLFIIILVYVFIRFAPSIFA